MKKEDKFDKKDYAVMFGIMIAGILVFYFIFQVSTVARAVIPPEGATFEEEVEYCNKKALHCKLSLVDFMEKDGYCFTDYCDYYGVEIK